MKITSLDVRQFSWCGLRDSNSRPLPWQGSALTTELNPHVLRRLYRSRGDLCKSIRDTIEDTNGKKKKSRKNQT